MELGEGQWRFDEYVYRHEVIPGLSHDAFMDEPGDVLAWNTHIHEVVERVRAEKARQEG